MDGPHDFEGDGRWLTYGELAIIRGTTRPSAERLARRMKWRRQAGNDGFARVFVPVAFLERAGDKAKDGPHEEQGAPPRDFDTAIAFQDALAALREAHAGEIAALIGRATAAESFAAELRARLDDMQSKLSDAQGELAAAKEDASRELEAVQMALAEAQADAAELRQAEAVRRARGLLVRLRAAWRGE
jgi:hypothetical protein